MTTRKTRSDVRNAVSHKVAQSVPDRFRRGPCVYFVGQAEEGPVKIGFSTDLPKRLLGLQNSCPVPVKLLAVVAGNREREREYHRKFEADRLHGEWFARSEAIISELVQIRWVGPMVDNIKSFAVQNERRRRNWQ